MWIFDRALGSPSIVTVTVVTAPFIHHQLCQAPCSMGCMLTFFFKGGNITWPTLPILQVEQIGVGTRSVHPEAHVSDISDFFKRRKLESNSSVLY